MRSLLRKEEAPPCEMLAAILSLPRGRGSKPVPSPLHLALPVHALTHAS